MSDDTADRELIDPEIIWDAKPSRMMVNVADLRRRLGQRRTEPIDVLLARRQIVGSSTTNTPTTGSVVVESIERGVSISGSVTFQWEGECRRCLDVIGGTETIEVYEIFQIDASDDSDINDFDGIQIDLLPVTHDAVGLSLPLVPLCRDDCAGPDPDRYPALLAEDIEEVEKPRDPRWGALDQLDL